MTIDEPVSKDRNLPCGHIDLFPIGRPAPPQPSGRAARGGLYRVRVIRGSGLGRFKKRGLAIVHAAPYGKSPQAASAGTRNQ